MAALTTQIPILCPVCRTHPTKAGTGFCSAACEATVEPDVASFWHFSAAARIEAQCIREFKRAKEGIVMFQ